MNKPYEESLECPKCKGTVVVPANASFSMCGCGHVLIDGATEVKP